MHTGHVRCGGGVYINIHKIILSAAPASPTLLHMVTLYFPCFLVVVVMEGLLGQSHRHVTSAEADWLGDV